MSETKETRTVVIKFDTKDSQLLNDASKKLSDINKNTKDLSLSFGKLGTIVKGLAVAFVANEIRTFVQDIIQTGAELKNMSQATGVSVEDLSKLKIAAELSGVPMEKLTVALRRLNVNAVAASTGNTAMAKSFEAFGISVKDLQTLSPANIILKMSDSYKKLADDQNKAALTTKIFGRSGTDITSMLNLGSEAIQKYNLHIDDEFATHAKEFVNNVQLMKLELKNLALDGFGVVLPVLNEAIEKWDSFGNLNIEVSGKTKYLQGAMVTLSIAVKTVSAVVGEAWDLLKFGFQATITHIAGAVEGLVSRVDDAWRRLKDLAHGNLEGFVTADYSQTNAGMSAYIAKLDKETKDFALKSKTRFYDVLTFAGNLEDSLQKDAKPLPEKLAKPKVDAGEINKRLAHERELLTILKEQTKEQAALGELELRKYKLTAVAYENEKDRYKTQLATEKALKGFDLKNPKEAAIASQYRVEADLQEKAREQNRLALEEQKHGFEGFKVGATEAFMTYLEVARDVATQTKALFIDAFKHMEDGIVTFVKTGKFNMADFANAVIDDIIRIQVRMALAGFLSQIGTAIGGAFSGGGGDVSGGGQAGGWAPNLAANGGVMTDTGMLPLQKYASGGIASSPQVAIFGEGRRPEAYVPLPDGRNIPVKMEGSSGGGDTNVTVQVNVESGQENVKASTEKAKALGKTISSIVVSELIRQKRPGGLIPT